jgi:hypothetical protein
VVRSRGGPVSFQICDTGITGRLGGKWTGKDITLIRTAQGYEGTLGKHLNIKLVQEEDRYTGRIGHNILGTSWDLQWAGNKLNGRFGGELMGYDANLEAQDTAPLTVAVIACLAYYWYSETAPNSRAKF